MKRELDQAKKQSLAEAEERKRAAEAHERKMKLDARAEWQRLHGEREAANNHSTKKSRPEEESKESQRPAQPRKRDSHQEPISSTTIRRPTPATSPKAAQSSAIPTPPPMPSITSPSQPIRTILPTPSSTLETITSQQQSTSTDEPKLKATDYALPAVGSQEYDRFMINGRRVPIHESQKIEVKDTKSSPLPNAPAPVGRLNGIIKPADIPSFSHIQSGTSQNTLAGRKPSITRKSSNPKPQVLAPVELAGSDELQAKLMARRKWEDELDNTADVLITPSESVSTNSTGSASSSSTGWTEVPAVSAGHINGGVEAATVLGGSVLDQKRRSGWR